MYILFDFFFLFLRIVISVAEGPSCRHQLRNHPRHLQRRTHHIWRRVRYHQTRNGRFRRLHIYRQERKKLKWHSHVNRDNIIATTTPKRKNVPVMSLCERKPFSQRVIYWHSAETYGGIWSCIQLHSYSTKPDFRRTDNGDDDDDDCADDVVMKVL